MKTLVLETLDRPYDPYRSRAFVEADADTEDEACDKLEAALAEMRRERMLRGRSRAGGRC